MTPELEQLKALAEAATKGPWIAEPGSEWKSSIVTKTKEQGTWALADVNLRRDEGHANRQYIAFANPERILALIAENEKMIAACALYDKALLSSYPTGASGPAWVLWNSARKTLGETK